MKRLFLISLLALMAASAAAQNTDNKLVTPFDRYVDSIARDAYKNKDYTGLMIGLVAPGHAKTYAYGETARGNNTLPDVKTVYEIGSITKTFTGLLLALQVQRGKIKPDDDVNKYLPDSVKIPSFEGVPVTMVSLSNHTSGLPRFDPVAEDPEFDSKAPYANFTENKLFSFLRTFQPSRKPGTKYGYTNIGTGLLGTLLARNARTTFAQLLQREIFLPLQLRDTRLDITPAMKSRLAQGYSAGGAPRDTWEFKALAGCGGIKSTMEDMIVYAKANMSTAPTILEKAMQLSHQPTYRGNGNTVGMGWHVIEGNRRTIVWHNGQTDGYYSMMYLEPATGKAVIVLSNVSKPNSIGDLLIRKW